MDSSTRPAITSAKSRLARTFVKVLHARTATGIAPVDGFHKLKTDEKIKSFNQTDEERKRIDVAMEALLARVFASISCIKAAYAELQLAQSPYDADAIQRSDGKVVSELKIISELKQRYLNNQLDSFHEKVLVSSEIIEQKSVLKTYEILTRKLESQFQLKKSELTSLHLSGLNPNPNHFVPVLRHAIRSIRSFVKLIVGEMLSSGWDLDSAVEMIHPGVLYWKQDHKCFTIESFVSRVMFNGFHNTNDSGNRKGFFFEEFVEMKSVKAKDYLAKKPNSTFGRFCKSMYLRLVHPKLELSFFGNLNQRETVESGEFFPETGFFTAFAEMARRVWILHCLGFSFDTPAAIFQVENGCRFSEVFMESVADEGQEPTVAFTVVPGFKIGKTVIQSQVYLSRS